MSGMDDRLARVALCSLVEPGHRAIAQSITEHGAGRTVGKLLAGELGARAGAAARARLAGADPHARAATLCERAQRLGVRIIVPGDVEWPAQIDDLNQVSTDDDTHIHAPMLLWARGPLRLNEVTRNAVSIVGARAASPYGNHVARELGYGLAERRWTVISGAAYGIDGAAHRGALAALGYTVAVLACGLDTVYPVGHAALLDQIAERGLLVSEWPPGANPAKHRFLIRNRLIAGLARGVVVVEAARRSGSRLTARRAVELGRFLMAVPGAVTSALSEGTHDLVREWRAELVTSAAHIIEIVGELGETWEGRADLVRSDLDAPRDKLDARCRAVYDAIPMRGALHLDELALRTDLPVDDVAKAIATLALAGIVEPAAEGRHSIRLTPVGRCAGVRPPSIAPSLR